MPKTLTKKAIATAPAVSSDPNILTGDSDHVAKTYREVSYKSLILNPAENYRWGSAEARDRDLKRSSTLEDGSVHTPYEAIKSSIHASGVTDPIGVVEDMLHANKYRVIFGFTRATAATDLRLERVPVIVYDGLTRAEEMLMQVQENSTQLRRETTWGVHSKMIVELHKAAKARFDANSKMPRPRDTSSGKGASAFMCPDHAAYFVLAQRIGVYYTTLRDHARTYTKLDERVKDWADRGIIGYTAAKEFVTGREEDEDGYTPEFVKAVMDEVKRNCPDLKSVTPKRVQDAKMNVIEWLAKSPDALANGKPLWLITKKGEDPTKVAFQPIDTPRPSPGCARDIAVNFASQSVARLNLTVESTVGAWEAIKKDVVWFRVAGMGYGSGDILRPADADNPNGCAMSDLLTREFSYAAAVFARTAIRDAVVIRLRRYAFSEWLSASSTKAHHITLATAIDDAINADKTNRVGAIVADAWRLLRLETPEAGWVTAIENARKKNAC